MAGATLQRPTFPARWLSLDDLRLLGAATYKRVVVAGGILIWAVGGLGFTLAAVPSYLLRSCAVSRISRSLLRYTFRFFLRYLATSGLVRLEFGELERFAREASQLGAPPLIIAPNHPSLLDAIFIMAYVPNVTCVIKASLRRNPFLSGGAKLSGFICNKSPRGMVEQSVEALKAGSNLLIFPEGTRTGVGADGVGQFKAGVALIAKLSHKKILPVYLTANSRYLSKDWPIYRLPPVPLCYRATVGGLMSPEPGERARTFLKRMELGYRRQLHSVDR